MSYGWRARFGFVAPSKVIDVRGVDLYRLLPDGVMPVMTCLGVQGLSDDSSVREALPNLERCVRALTDFHADVILLGGNPLGALGGVQGEKSLIDKVSGWTGLPTTTTTRAAVEALRHLGASRVAVASPLEKFQNDKVKRYLEEAGCEVTGVHGLEVPHEQVRKLERAASYRAARAAVTADGRAEAVYLPGSSWPTLDNIALLEDELGIPVIASVAASTWHALRLIHIPLQRPEFGRLLARR